MSMSSACCTDILNQGFLPFHVRHSPSIFGGSQLGTTASAWPATLEASWATDESHWSSLRNPRSSMSMANSRESAWPLCRTLSMTQEGSLPALAPVPSAQPHLISASCLYLWLALTKPLSVLAHAKLTHDSIWSVLRLSHLRFLVLKVLHVFASEGAKIYVDTLQ
ncbi:hypothetical protein FA95DRAFT_916809 [Auriscalpium vulgare]|uniref:Uncharacterized protein n=1 Tax=Auriscalpium vulgare TaxID=40419 RepID=A0ACB8R8B8_9AGAM|nr:hypothetical protein FA95DRAFT_916809 [Auriscalpium vulgare]